MWCGADRPVVAGVRVGRAHERVAEVVAATACSCVRVRAHGGTRCVQSRRRRGLCTRGARVPRTTGAGRRCRRGGRGAKSPSGAAQPGREGGARRAQHCAPGMRAGARRCVPRGKAAPWASPRSAARTRTRLRGRVSAGRTHQPMGQRPTRRAAPPRWPNLARQAASCWPRCDSTFAARSHSAPAPPAPWFRMAGDFGQPVQRTAAPPARALPVRSRLTAMRSVDGA
jgi:hypothetical protein